MKPKIEWIDISIGIGILLVILGHTDMEPNLKGQIYAFHMPLLFFIAGYLFSEKKHSQTKGFIFSKAKSLLVPYVTFSILSIYIGKYLYGNVIDIQTFAKSLLFSKRNDIYFDQPLWLLTSLFTLEILFYYFVKYVKKSLLILLLATGMSIFSIWTLDAIHATKVLPWSLDQSLYYSFYFALGLVMKNANFLSGDGKKSPILILSSVIYIYFLIDGSVYTELYQYLAGISYIPSYVSLFLYNVIWAILAIFFVLYLSQFLSLSIIQFLGKHSIIFLALHTCLGFSLINKFVADQISVYITNPNLLGIVYAIVSIIIVSPVAVLINKLFPFIIGKNYGGDKKGSTTNSKSV